MRSQIKSLQIGRCRSSFVSLVAAVDVQNPLFVSVQCLRASQDGLARIVKVDDAFLELLVGDPQADVPADLKSIL
jgi:hypothetical protein